MLRRSAVAPMVVPGVGFLLVGNVHRTCLIFDAFDNTLRGADRIALHDLVAAGNAGQGADATAVERQAKLVLQIVALPDKVEAIALAGEVGDDERTVPGHDLVVMDIALAKTGRVLPGSLAVGLGNGGKGDARQRGGKG